MNNILKYRFVAFALVVVFGVFNIGIPIIIASCPMAAMMQGNTCGMCNDEDASGTPRVTTERNTSCCVTTILAERNANEFVQANGGVSDAGKLLLSALIPVVSVTVLQSRIPVVSQISTSPPAVTDIPILTSSLLI